MDTICYLKLMLHKSQQLGLCVLIGLIQVIPVKAQDAAAAGANSVSTQEASTPISAPGDVQSGGESGHNKPYSLSANLRQGYDDNVYTTHSNQVSSWYTGVTPSILVNYPMDQTLFSARYTFDGTYYWNRTAGSDDWDTSHEFLGRINHSVSERFNIDARETFTYAENPQVANNGAALQRNGDYIHNGVSLQGSYQWTPKFATVTTYTNDVYAYNDQILKEVDNYMSNSISNDFRYLIDPTVTLVLGGSFEDVGYEYIARNYDTYTGYVGADWQLSPQVSLSGRVGGEIFDPNDGGSQSTSPYGSLGLNWILGARSTISANYSHAISQTDIATSYGQETDTFSLNLSYQWTPRITTSLIGSYQYGQYTSDLALNGGVSGYSEEVTTFNFLAVYQINAWLDTNLSYTFTDVEDNQLSDRAYTRNQISLGVRATY